MFLPNLFFFNTVMTQEGHNKLHYQKLESFSVAHIAMWTQLKAIQKKKSCVADWDRDTSGNHSLG